MTIQLATPHEDREHAMLAPSKMKMHFNCKASLIPLEHPVPEIPSPSALEGTKAHELMELSLKELMARECTEDSRLEPGKLPWLQYRQQYGAEMTDHIKTLVKRIVKVIETIGIQNVYRVIVETPVKFSENIYGTLDVAILYVKDGERRAYILDLKYGKGTPVSARGNEQLGTYLVAVLRTEEWDAKQGTIVVYQPRNSEVSENPFDQWKVEHIQIRTLEKQLVKFEKEAMKILRLHAEGKETDVVEVVGDWCRFCPRKAICKTFARTNSVDGLLMLDDAEPLEQLDVPVVLVKKRGRTPIKIPDPKEIPDEQISIILKQADSIREFLKAVEVYAAARFFSAKKLPGWKLVAGRSSRKWLDDETLVFKKLRKLGVKEPFNMKLKGITEIEQEIGKGMVDELTIHSTPKPKLAPVDDPRPAITNRDISLLSEISEEDE